MDILDLTIIPKLFILIIILSLSIVFISKLQNLNCESYCQQVATENYNKGYQTGKSEGVKEGYYKGYQECEEFYKSKYSECLSLLNLTNLSLQNCAKELEDCKFQLNKTVSLYSLINEYKIYPKNITVKQLFIYFTITIGVTFTLIEISIKIILKKYKRLEEILDRIFLTVALTIIVITLIDIFIKVAYFLAH
jgi:hypothetical protein